MSLEYGTELREAEAKLNALEAERIDLQGRLANAVEEADADAIVRLERRDRQIDVELFAARAKVLKLRRSEVERLRVEAIGERQAIEAELVEASRVYALKVNEADEARQRMQLLQVKAYGSESKAEQCRQDGNDLNSELKNLVNSRIGRRYEGVEAKP